MSSQNMIKITVAALAISVLVSGCGHSGDSGPGKQGFSGIAILDSQKANYKAAQANGLDCSKFLTKNGTLNTSLNSDNAGALNAALLKIDRDELVSIGRLSVADNVVQIDWSPVSRSSNAP